MKWSCKEYLFLFTALITASSEGLTKKTLKELSDKFPDDRSVDDVYQQINVQERDDEEWPEQNDEVFDEDATIPTLLEDFPCAPRDVIEEIKESNIYSLYTRCMKVKRCNGCCQSSSKKCVVKTKETKYAYVYKTPDFSQLKISYEDHTSCQCQCKVEASHCVYNQTYEPHNCRCVCNLPTQTCSAGNQWSTSHCGCICDTIQTCPRGFIWNNANCQCECPSITCPQGTSVNPSTCLCV